MKKPGQTIDDHKAAGLVLKQILESLLSLKVTLNNCYSEKKFPARLLSEAIESVMKIRCRAERRLFEEYPQEANTQIYFGPLDEKKERRTWT